MEPQRSGPPPGTRLRATQAGLPLAPACWQSDPMTEPLCQSRQPGVRAAMFVDFDNVYTVLQALDPAAAKKFAEDPKHWTEALADGVAGEDSRRFLIRNCYLNPVIYSKYRPYWTRAGFRVIDSRAAVNFILQGLGYAGIPLTEELPAAELAAAWTRNVEELCRVALVEFDDAEKLALRSWAGGGLV